MKNLFSFLGITTVFFITSCTRQVNTPSGNNNGNNSNSTIVTGNFTITKFTDNNSAEDKSADFDGYTFQFTEQGKIMATRNGSTDEGTYTEKPSHEGEGAKLVISFSSQALSRLNKSWLIVTITDSEIDLKDDDAASNETLQFSAL
jgi:hypothetical protein